MPTPLFSQSSWTEPKDWSEWNFLDYCNCPDLEAYQTKAPKVFRTCPHCGKTEKWTAIEAAAFPAIACDHCCEAYQNQNRSPAAVKLVTETLENVIPPLYRETDKARIEKEKSWEQVSAALSWTQDRTKKNLALVGDTRTGKTRTLCLLLEKLIRSGTKVRAFFHGSFYDELLEVMRSDRNFRKWKAEIVKAEIVAIDDLFAEKLTERGEASLFEILDARICNHRPTFITTQVTAAESLARFHSKKRAEAFFSRLNEFFELVQCGGPVQTNLKIIK